MAHRRRHVKKGATHRRRRSKMGAVSKNEISYTAMMMIGGIAGGIAATAIQRALPNLNQKIVSVVQIGAGGFAAIHFKHAFLKGVGYGVGVAGATNLAHNMGILKGVENVINGLTDGDGYSYQLNGISNGAMLNGISNGATLNGGGGRVGEFYVTDDEYNTGTLGTMNGIAV